MQYLPGHDDPIHLNRVFFFEQGRAVPRGTVRHFDLPALVLDFVSAGGYCRQQGCTIGAIAPNEADREALRAPYMAIMARAMAAPAEPPERVARSRAARELLQETGDEPGWLEP